MDEIYEAMQLPDPKPTGPPVMTHTWHTRTKYSLRFGERCYIEAQQGKQVLVRFADGLQVLTHCNHVRKIV